MSVQSIRQGEMSARTSDGGAYSARLAAFQENYTRPQFTDTVKEFTDIINADQIKAEKFTESALGTKVVPSTTNMYESHFLLAKEKFDQLYSDETLDYFSKDEGGMQKWAGMVDKLNQEIATYEQIYQDSFGTASATGEGGTWSDHRARINAHGGDEQAWFRARGLNLVNPDSFNETMKTIDGRGHTNLTLDLESGTFNYDLAGGINKDWLEPTDPNTAANLFNYQTEQATFLTENEYVNEIFPTYDDDGKEAALVSLKNLKTNYNFQLNALSHYERNLSDDSEFKGMTPKELYDKLTDPQYTGLGLDGALEGFITAIIDGAENRQKIAEEKKKQDNDNDGPNRSFAASVYVQGAPVLDENGEAVGLPPHQVTDPQTGETTTAFVPNNFDYIGFNENIYTGRRLGNISQIARDKTTDEIYVYNAVTTNYEKVDVATLRFINNRLKSEEHKQQYSLTEYLDRLGGSSGGSGGVDTSEF